jgi:hypothetical protein
MVPLQIKPEQLQTYPPKARQLVVDHIALLRQLPTSFVPLLLWEIIAYDWKFPAEQKNLNQQLAYLESLSPEQRQELMAGFAKLRLSPELESFDWVSAPVQYFEKLTAHLWATHQIDSFRAAALNYGRQVDSARSPELPPIPCVGIVVIGKGVAATKYPLFRKLREHGTYFTGIRPESGVRILLDTVAARAAAHPIPFGTGTLTAERRSLSPLQSWARSLTAPSRRCALPS